MYRQPRGLLWLLVLLGVVGGFGLAMLIQSGSVPAQSAGLKPDIAMPVGYSPAGKQVVPTPANPQIAALPTPDTSGAILASGTPTATTMAPDLPVDVAPSSSVAPAAQQAGRAFTYQGVLRNAGQPLQGSCNLQFGLWDDSSLGAQLGVTQTITTTLTNGQITVLLNDANQFGDTAFDGRATWLSINARCPSGTGSYSSLVPRQALTAAPLAAGLVPHSTLRAGDTYSGFSVLTIDAPNTTWNNSNGLKVTAGSNSNWIGSFNPVGVWTDSASGIGLWATTNNGTALQANTNGGGWAGSFYGDVQVNGKLYVPRFQVQRVINQIGPLPITSGSFSTSGGTLVLFYSGSGYASSTQNMIGMIVKLDGNTVDQTGVFANDSGKHLAFVAKQWVLTGIAAGTHTISLTPMSGTSSDYNDIFEVTVTEMPY